MADATTTIDPVEETAPLTVESLLASVGDDSRVENIPAFSTMVEKIGDALKTVGADLRRITNHRQEVAKLKMQLAAMVFRPNGYPDWACSTDAYKKAYGLAMDRSWTGLSREERNSENNSIGKHVERTYRLRAVAWHVLQTLPSLAEARKAAEKSEADFLTLVSNPPENLKAAVLEQYRAQVSADGKRLLSDPKGYADTAAVSGPTSGPGQNPGKTAADIVRDAAVSAGNLSAYYGAASILGTLLAQAEKLTSGEVENRDAVRAMLADVHAITAELLRSIDGKAGEKDRQNLATLITAAQKHLSAVK